jgi:hypothetical protein
MDAEIENESTGLSIQLGDIIELIAPSEYEIHNKLFFVYYIDNLKIKLLSDDGILNYVINIKDDGSLSNESIISINILSRSEELGYARQNSLLPDKWINIYFNGDIPTIITGKISNIEEDMIEVKTYPDEDIIYIDFAYKGLPEDLPIEKITIRNAPYDIKAIPAIQEEEIIKGYNEEAVSDKYGTEEESISGEELKRINEQPQLKQQLQIEEEPYQIKNKIKEVFLDADQILLGEELQDITYIVNVPESEQRYSIEKQASDLLDDLLASIPNTQRTSSVLNNIHRMIERFKQLRNEYSKFDKYGNAELPDKKGPKYKPLIDSLLNLNKKLYWIIPVCKNKKKIYDIQTIPDEIEFTNLSLLGERTDESELFRLYKNNSIPDENNSYNYLISKLNYHFTPFDNPSDFSYKLTSLNVNDNINAIIDNLGELSSIVVKNDELVKRKFVIQTYNLGLTKLQPNEFQNRKIYFNREKLTQNDNIYLKSFITLPEPVLRYSRVNLPGTNILEKSNLNMNNVNYWKIFNKKTSINTQIIDNFDENTLYDESNYLSDIKEYILDESISDNDKYKKYLNSIIPMTRILFNLTKKYITGKLSFYDIIKYLEPFLIYQKDLSFFQYKIINEFILDKIKDENKKFIERAKLFRNLLNRYKNSNLDLKSVKYNIFNDLHKTYKINNDVLDYYDKIDISNITKIEGVNIINEYDYGVLYSTICTINNIDLIVPNMINQLAEKIEQNEIYYKNEIQPQNDNCPRFVLSKQYKTIEQLENDNNKDIYFDKEYDPTRYDIIKEYNYERNNMNTDEFISFLTENLVTSIGLTYEDANKDANSMINGKRKVINGDYSVLEIINYEDSQTIMNYYRRENNIWILEDNPNNVLINDNKTFCNTNEECLSINKKCNDIDTSEYNLKNQNINLMLKEFQDKLNIQKENLISILNYNIKYHIDKSKNIYTMHMIKILKYNKIYYDIGLLYEKTDVVQSPYFKIRDIILGQEDFSKKQNDIIKFVNKFTRNAYEDKGEDPYWFYCFETDVKLLPTFIYELANGFNTGNYVEVIEKICAKQGTISDDGNMWVDKHSGYIIRTIDFNDEEGYDERGFKIVSHELLNESLEEKIKNVNTNIESTEKKKKYESYEAEIISNIVYAMSSFMYINIDNVHEYIIKNSLETFQRTMPSKEIHEKTAKLAEEKGKRLPSYQERYDTTILFITLSYLLVGILISQPSIKTKKTYPGCIKSFTGFPLTGVEDKTGLIYISCIANKIKSSIRPWNSIIKMNSNTLTQKLEQIIERYVLTNKEIESKLIEKREYLLLEGLEEIPYELDIARFTNFLPPLISFKIKTPINITSDFKSLLINNVKGGKKEQDEQLFVIKSKIIQYSLYIQNLIQNVISKEIPILKTTSNEPFLENSCCNNDGINTYNYFSSRETSMTNYCEIVTELNNIFEDMCDMSKSSILLDPNDTRKVFLPFSNEFSEKTIYQAFIVYCKFNSDTPISEHLQKICLQKPDDFNNNDSIDDKIQKLKRDGKTYSTESLEYLIDIINSMNIISNINDQPDLSYSQILRNITNYYIDYGKATQFELSLNKMLDTYDIALEEDTQEMREFKNYLSKTNDSMSNEILEFIKINHKMKTSEYNNLTTILNTLMNFNNINSDLFEDDIDCTTYHSIQYIKQSLRDLIFVYPNIILNNVDYKSINIPKHWNLSSIHQDNIKIIVRKYYTKLEYHYKNKNDIEDILKQISVDMNDIYTLALNTPFLSPILNNKKKIYSIFERRMAGLLFNYYLLTVLKRYIILSNKESDVSMKIKENISIDTNEIVLEEPKEISEMEIVIGNKKDLSEKVANLLYTFILMINENKTVINFNYEQLSERVLRIKEKEKENITYDLEKMTDDERNVEKVFKAHKLEKWGIGLQKGLTRYDPELYDKERLIAEKRALLDIELGKNMDVNIMNADIFALDLENKMNNDEMIEREAYNMSDLPEDDDYGDNDEIEDYRNDLYPYDD